MCTLLCKLSMWEGANNSNEQHMYFEGPSSCPSKAATLSSSESSEVVLGLFSEMCWRKSCKVDLSVTGQSSKAWHSTSNATVTIVHTAPGPSFPQTT